VEGVASPDSFELVLDDEFVEALFAGDGAATAK